jgi:peptidase M42 family hydrolase
MMPEIDTNYIATILKKLVDIPSPSGMTDEIVRTVCRELEQFKVPYELTRRGAVRANLTGAAKRPRRAVVVHLDTLGGMVNNLKQNGRLSLEPIGTWSARFAEGARVTVHSDHDKLFRGTVLPLKASGHRYNEEIDRQPSNWDNLEIRLDEMSTSLSSIWDLGIRVGDFVSFDVDFEMTQNGFINSRHLDDKAGVAALLAVAKAFSEQNLLPPLSSHLLFTISEEVGVGASHILRGDVAEMVSIDNGTIAVDQNTCEMGATIAMKDSSGPFDLHLSRHLIELCMREEIEFSRDVFRHYRSDAAAALEAGNDIRTALVCFGLDASHGYERTHINSLRAVASLIGAYLLSEPLFSKEVNVIGPEKTFPLIKGNSERKPF